MVRARCVHFLHVRTAIFLPLCFFLHLTNSGVGTRVLGRQLPLSPPPPRGLQPTVAKGAAPRRPWAPKARGAPWAPKVPEGKVCPLCTPTLSLTWTLFLCQPDLPKSAAHVTKLHLTFGLALPSSVSICSESLVHVASVFSSSVARASHSSLRTLSCQLQTLS